MAQAERGTNPFVVSLSNHEFYPSTYSEAALGPHLEAWWKCALGFIFLIQKATPDGGEVVGGLVDDHQANDGEEG